MAISDHLTKEQIQNILKANNRSTNIVGNTPESNAEQDELRDSLNLVSNKAKSNIGELALDLLKGTGSEIIGIREEVTNSARQLTDAFGLTDSKVTTNNRKKAAERRRQWASGVRNKKAFKVGQFIGREVPAALAGGAVFKAARALGAIRAGIISGAAIEAGRDEEKGLAQKGLNIATAGAVGGAAGAITQMFNLPRNKEALEAFEKAHVKPILSNIVDSPEALSGARMVQSTLNNIPLVGVKRQVRQQAIQFTKAGKSLVSEIDNAVPSAKLISNQFDDVFKSVGNTPIDLKYGKAAVNKGIKSVLDDSSLIKANTTVSNALVKLKNAGTMTLKDAHLRRREIDDALSLLYRKTFQGEATKREISALVRVRRLVERDIELAMRKAGKSQSYKLAKKQYIQRRAADNIKAAYEESIKDGFISPNKFANNISKLMKSSVNIPKDYKAAIKGLQLVARKIGDSKLIPKEGINIMDIIAGGTLATSGTGAIAAGLAPGMTAGGLAGLALASKAVGSLITTKTGLKLLTRVGQEGLKGKAFQELLNIIPQVAGAQAAGVFRSTEKAIGIANGTYTGVSKHLSPEQIQTILKANGRL